MKQSRLGLGASTTRTSCRQFIEQMGGVVPWPDLVAAIAPFMSECKRGASQFPVKSLLRIHFRRWFMLRDPAIEEAPHDFRLFLNFADVRDQEALDRPDATEDVRRHVVMRYLQGKTDPMEALTERGEWSKASIRAMVEYQFNVIKHLFDQVKVCYCGLATNTTQLQTLFALANLWMVRRLLPGRLA